jgi:hypothetical protein
MTSRFHRLPRPSRTSRAFRMPGFLVASALAGGVVVSACGGSSPAGGFGSGSGSGNGSGESSGGGSGDVDGGGSIGLGGIGGGSGNLADAACASSSSKGQQAPLDMYIMLDQSGSMSDQVAGNTSKWAAVTGALNTFVSGTNTTGIAVGLQYFGLPPGGSADAGASSCPTMCTQTSDCGATGGPCLVGFCVGCIASGAGAAGGADSCTASDYATPDVEIAALPGVGPANSASIAKHSPSTSTPTSAALQGAVDHAQTWAKAHTSDVVIAVLATDGDPTECDTTLSDINAIAAAGVSGTPKVLTFVIGVGASTTALNGIAAAGGTTSAFLVDTTMNVNQQFLDALNKIRGTALGCNYTIPVPANGSANFAEINVQYTPSGGGAPELIPNVSGAAQCPATGDAWYYDNPSAPTEIVLCPGTCTTVEADQGGEIQVLVGCATVAK